MNTVGDDTIRKMLRGKKFAPNFMGSIKNRSAKIRNFNYSYKVVCFVGFSVRFSQQEYDMVAFCLVKRNKKWQANRFAALLP